VYGQIPVVKQQVAHALATIEGKIRTVERELKEYEQRNLLLSHITNTRGLIRERIEEGDALRNNYELCFETVLNWSGSGAPELGRPSRTSSFLLGTARSLSGLLKRPRTQPMLLMRRDSC
jgi:hypothetical protein